MTIFNGAVIGAVVGAVIAALGFVGKLVVEEFMLSLKLVRARKAALVRLQSLLLASKRVFQLQADQRDLLCDAFIAGDPALGDLPFDEVLARGYKSATEHQKMSHGLIRQYTVSAMRPLNRAMSDWLASDEYYKLNTHKGELGKLALALRTLDAHLVLWHAKYDYWIPDKPERALVYMADENEHGAGFPFGIDTLVERLAGGTSKGTG